MIYIKNIAILLLLLRVALQYSAESCGRKLTEPVSRNCSKSRLTSKTRQSTPMLLTQESLILSLFFLFACFCFISLAISDGLVLLSILDRHGVLSRLWKPEQPCLLLVILRDLLDVSLANTLSQPVPCFSFILRLYFKSTLTEVFDLFTEFSEFLDSCADVMTSSCRTVLLISHQNT